MTQFVVVSTIGRVIEHEPSVASKHTARGAGMRSLLKWLFCAAIAAFCLFRLATFTPQPLDSAGTLRPILYRWFLWFVNLHAHPEQAFSTWSGTCFLALMVPPSLAVLNYSRHRGVVRLPSSIASILCSRALLIGSIALCLFVCRYPILLVSELNPDEGQFIASAHKLFYDGNFFRSVDCGTSGPFNIYPLMLPAISGFSPDYASSRLIALILEFFSIYLLYRTIALIAADDVARVAIVPAVMAFATFKDRNLVHYSSEHVPLLLISLALYGAVRVIRNPEAYRVPVFLLGVIACAAFFAKMQSVPIVVAIAAVAVAYVQASGMAKWWRAGLLFLAGVAPLAVANAALCLVTGVWHDFVMAYIMTNLGYADMQWAIAGDLPWFVAYLVDTIEIRCLLFTFIALAAAYAYQRARGGALSEPAVFLRMAGIGGAAIAPAIFIRGWNNGADYAYVLWIAILVVPTYFVLSYRKGKFGTDPLSWFGMAALASMGAALFSIHQAHRPFPHYLLLLTIPAVAGMAWMLMRQVARRFAFVSLFVVLTVVYGSYLWNSQDDRAFKGIPYALRPLEGNLIRAMTAPGAQIVVWGWNVGPYLGSGRLPATRDTNMANFFSTRFPEISASYRQRFLRDLVENPAELFIDAVGPTSWPFTDRRFNRFEQCPEIKAYIDAHYVHLVDLSWRPRLNVQFRQRQPGGILPLPGSGGDAAHAEGDRPAA